METPDPVYLWSVKTDEAETDRKDEVKILQAWLSHIQALNDIEKMSSFKDIYDFINSKNKK